MSQLLNHTVILNEVQLYLIITGAFHDKGDI